MISVTNLSIQYGGRFLFDDISFTITNRDRIGLVGKNGAGKSTMLKIIIGEQRPESGSISMDNYTTLGYLPQEIKVTSDKTVYEEAATAFDEVHHTEAAIEEVATKIAESEDYKSPQYMKWIQELSDLQEHLLHSARPICAKRLKRC